MPIYIASDKMKNAFLSADKVKEIYLGSDLAYRSGIYFIKEGVVQADVATWTARGNYYDNSDTSANCTQYAPDEISVSGGRRHVHQRSPSGLRGAGIYYSSVANTQGCTRLHIEWSWRCGDNCYMKIGTYGTGTIPNYSSSGFTHASTKHKEGGTNGSETVNINISDVSRVRVALAMKGINDRTMDAYITNIWMD